MKKKLVSIVALLVLAALLALTLTGWYDTLAADGRVIDALQKRPWGDYDGTLIDRYGIRWLIGFHPED